MHALWTFIRHLALTAQWYNGKFPCTLISFWAPVYPCRIKTQSTLAHEINYIVNIGHREYSDALPPLPHTVHHLLHDPMLLWFKKLRKSGCGTLLCFHLYATRQQLNFLDACIFRHEYQLPDSQSHCLQLLFPCSHALERRSHFRIENYLTTTTTHILKHVEPELPHFPRGLDSRQGQSADRLLNLHTCT